MKKIITLMSCFLFINANAESIGNGELNTVSGNNDISVNKKKNDVKEDIKSDLSLYYQEESIINSLESEKINEDTDWTNISGLYNCGAWSDIGGGEEERTCFILKSKINKEKDVNSNQTLNDLILNYEEMEDTVVQRRGATAPVVTTPPVSIPEYVSGITVEVTAPNEVGLGESFDLSWDSTNAVQCSVPQNGVQLGKGVAQLTLLTLGNNNLTVSCTDGLSTESETVVVNVISIPLELEILTPIENQTFNFKESYILSYRSVGANECSIDGGVSNASNINRDITMSGSGVTTTHTIVCSDGTDSISRSVTIQGILPPPENGACGWGYSEDLRIGWNINFHAPDRLSGGVWTIVTTRPPPNPVLTNGRSMTFTMESDDLCDWRNCRGTIGGNRCDFGGTLIWRNNRYICCNRVNGQFRVTLTCNNGRLTATRNRSTCDVNGSTYSFLVQDFNVRAVRYRSGTRSTTGAYSYSSTVIWTNPN